MSDELKKLKIAGHQRDYKIKHLEALVLKDPLTGLYNRRGFLELVEKFFGDLRFKKNNPRIRREHFFIESLTILFFDIDNFKKINDAYGHGVGDKVLQFVASIIETKVRASDIVGRWGGEELVVALIGADEKDGMAKAEEIRKTIRSRVKIPKLDMKVTVSIGVAEYKGKGELKGLIQNADEAMYKAKKGGKDRVVVFS